MCGIAGLSKPSGSSARESEIQPMMAAIKHRGPDDHGFLLDGPIALASTRLSIQDTSPAGHMPFVDRASKATIVHNGEIYNFKELRNSLEGPFESSSDTEVILKGYLQKGIDFIDALNGIFAFAIWDPYRGQLILARDRLGVKPLFFCEHNGAIAFASEIKALVALGVKPEPDLSVVSDYLVHGVYEHSDYTFFSGVRQLHAGSYAIVKDSNLKEHRYWSLDDALGRVPSVNSFSDAVSGFIDLSQDALEKQLRSDVPIVAHVSGGLDSAMMAANLNALQGGQGNIRALSYYFGEDEYDERPLVEALMRDIGWDASFVQFSAHEVPDLVDEAMYCQEQPFPGIITLAKHKLIKHSHHLGAKVILEGQGGDEIGAGYPYAMGAYIHDLLREGRTTHAHYEIECFAELNGISPLMAYRKIIGSMASIWNTGWSADGSSYLKPHCINESVFRSRKPEFSRPFGSELLNLLYRDLFHTKLPRILRSCDRASMAYGRELRVPFLDHRLVEFVLALPNEYKISAGAQRAFYRAALDRVAPNTLSALPKHAVADPQRDWLRSELREWAGDLLHSKSFSERGLVNAQLARAEYDSFCSEQRGTGNSFHIWQWLSLELWFRTFID